MCLAEGKNSPHVRRQLAEQADYEAAVERFVLGEDDAPALVATLIRLEMERREAERAAYAAEVAHYGSDK